MLPATLKVACLQWNIQANDVDANFAAFDRLLDKAVAAKADMVALPEMWSRGFCEEALKEEGSHLPARLGACAERARKHRVWLAAGTLPEPASPGKVFNTFHLINPEGEVCLSYRKIHLFPNTGEPKFFDAGTDIPRPFVSGPWKIGAGICFDLRFPEFFRAQMKRGANLFFVPAQFPNPRTDHFSLFSQARALENLSFLAAINCCGNQPKLSFSGKSAIIDPLGKPLTEIDNQEGMIAATIDAGSLEKTRRDLPFLECAKLL